MLISRLLTTRLAKLPAPASGEKVLLTNVAFGKFSTSAPRNPFA